MPAPTQTPQQMLDALRASMDDMSGMSMRMKALLYGVSGVGKTVEAMELAQKCTPPDKRILYIDTGEGWVSLLNHPQLMRRTKRMVYTGLSQIEVLVNAIKAGLPDFNDFGTVVFDEFSTSAKQFLHVVLDATGVDNLTEAPEFKQWGILSRNIEKTVWKLLELKESHNYIFIAHERMKKDKQTKIEMVAPSFMESIEATVKENVHIVARMTAEVSNREGAPQYVRKMQVHPTKLVVAKSRVGKLDILVSPEKFNTRIDEWLKTGGVLVDENEVVELEAEKAVSTELADQAVDFTGYEVTESEM